MKSATEILFNPTSDMLSMSLFAEGDAAIAGLRVEHIALRCSHLTEHCVHNFLQVIVPLVYLRGFPNALRAEGMTIIQNSPGPSAQRKKGIRRNPLLACIRPYRSPCEGKASQTRLPPPFRDVSHKSPRDILAFF